MHLKWGFEYGEEKPEGRCEEIAWCWRTVVWRTAWVWCRQFHGIRTNEEKPLGTPSWQTLRKSSQSHSKLSQNGLKCLRNWSLPYHWSSSRLGWTAPWWGLNHCQSYKSLIPTSNALIMSPKMPIRIIAKLSTFSDFSVLEPILPFTEFRELPRVLPNGPSWHKARQMSMHREAEERPFRFREGCARVWTLA